MANNRFEKFKSDTKEIRNQAREKTVGYILTALGLVAGLAWNEAIKAVIDMFIQAPQNSILAKMIYAVVITIVVVIVSVYLTRLSKKNQETKQ